MNGMSLDLTGAQVLVLREFLQQRLSGAARYQEVVLRPLLNSCDTYVNVRWPRTGPVATRPDKSGLPPKVSRETDPEPQVVGQTMLDLEVA